MTAIMLMETAVVVSDKSRLGGLVQEETKQLLILVLKHEEMA